MEKPLFTPEHIVFRNGILKADITKPVLVYDDIAGNQALVDGNHRCYKAYTEGLKVIRNIIGILPRDVSKDYNFRTIERLKIIDK